MRQLLLGISAGGTLWVDFAVAIGFLVAMPVIAAKTYRARSSEMLTP
jgi:hypothetical protein